MPKIQEKDCWLFLDCKVMTGELPENCSNHEVCKALGLPPQNRMCGIPYQMWLLKIDQLFKVSTLEVLKSLDSEAKEAGYSAATNICYSYKDYCLTVGRDEFGFSLDIPAEARALGFAEAEKMPYQYRRGKLEVINQGCHYPKKFQDAGWYNPIQLPYCYKTCDQVTTLFVNFDIIHPEYNELKASGWHPPVSLNVKKYYELYGHEYWY
ncbi:hypothetical protein A4S05_24100 [Nostoc sp. KVJ20]|uniref:hypothetical protein n=1 Tax=Nostoc sp. KVJ20 TaxID=457944 RepID=UPI00083D7678|nr:hypothetical protein [Nostoc sp. KVJ20]ODH02365.1 hypothetical protein A4S05_24100 [Nostoc sp. KVJ20]